MQACDDNLNRAVTIFLLVRQQLERIDLSHSPNGAACALNTFASWAFTPSCTTSILLGALHIRVCLHKPHTTQLQCFFFLLSPCPVETHQMQSSKVKLLQCGQTYNKMTPPSPSTGAMIRRKKSVLFSEFPAQCPNVQFHPLPPSRKLREFFRWSTQTLSFLPVSLIKVLPTTILHCKVAATHHLGTTVCINTSF